MRTTVAIFNAVNEPSAKWMVLWERP